MTLFLFDWLGFLPEFFLSLVLLFYFMYGIEKDFSWELSIQGKVILFWVVLLLIFGWSWVNQTNWSFLFLNSYVVDGWVITWKVFFLFFIFFFLFFLKKEKSSFEWFTLVLLFQLATFVLLSASHFLVFYLSLELSSFILYLLVGSRRESLDSTEAGLKFFVLGSFGSILLLIGVVLCYGITGTLVFSELILWSEAGYSPPYLIALFFFLVGIFFKLGVAPFHFWIPDVYHGSSWSVVYFLVVISKIGMFGFFLRFVYTVCIIPFEWISFLFFWLAFFSLWIGTLGAVNQVNMKRLIGYSGISHMGFLMFGIGIGNGFGLMATLSYFWLYVSLNSLWILLLWWNQVFSLHKLKEFFPWFGFLLAVAMFSITGVPPLSGFFMKYYLWFGLIQIGNYLIGFLLVLFSVVAAFYYLRLIRMFFFSGWYWSGSISDSWREVGSLWFLIFVGYFSLFFFFFQKYVYVWLLEGIGV